MPTKSVIGNFQEASETSKKMITKSELRLVQSVTKCMMMSGLLS